jgi:mono/diheme cytochrome c family protein
MLKNHQRYFLFAATGAVAFIGVLGSVNILKAQGASTQTPAAGSVTFNKDIAPILQQNCQSCHRPGQIGPMSLLSYQEARPWARSIKAQVVARNMPPWFIDKHIGIQKFKNDISLSDKQIALIAKWVDAGAPEGNSADLPTAKAWDDSTNWHIGKPDVVVTLKKDIIVKAKAADAWYDLPAEDLGFKTDRYVTAVEIKPIKGFKVLHHNTSTLAEPDDEEAMATSKGTSNLQEYAVGKYGNVFPDGTAMLVRAGSKLFANIHTHADGEETAANFAWALKLLPEGQKPAHVMHSQQLGGPGTDIDIPANQKNVRVDGYTVFTKPAVITAFQPHMHIHGQAQCAELIYPASTLTRLGNARTETMACTDRFKFDWHVTYEFADDVQPIIPAGTILHVISLYDNTQGNKAAADPFNWTGPGNRTIDEMGFAWINWYDLTDEEYTKAVAARKALQKKPSVTAGTNNPQEQLN